MFINKTSKILKKKNYNIFLSILRMYLAFIVVNSHCYKPSKNFIKYKYILKILKNEIHVPTFFIISFYFCNHLFISKDIKRIKERFERLLIPYILWPIIIWIFNNAFYYCFDWKIKHSFHDLKMQLLTGHSFITVLWFQYNLIFITILILIIELLASKNKLFIYCNILIISYIFQYSNINYEIFSKYNFNLKYPFGRFLEAIPFCLTGSLFSCLNMDIYLKKNKIKSLYILLLILIVIDKYNIFILIKGFRYQGIKLLIICLVIFCIVLLMPAEIIKNNCIIKIVKFITGNTAGIYVLHIPIKLYTEHFILLIKNQTLRGSLLIYIICFFISFFGLFFFRKSKLKNLFQ